MSVKFKSIARKQPGVAGGGSIKYYAAIVRKEKVDLRKLMAEISDMHFVHPGAVISVLEAFLLRVNHHLTDGRAIDLGQLGTFYPSISSSSEDEQSAVDSLNIERFKVIFRPSQLLRKRMSRAEFEKLADDSSETTA